MSGRKPLHLLERIIQSGKKRGALAVDVLWSVSSGREFVVKDGVLERARSSSSEGVGVRVLDSSGRQGLASLSYMDEDSCDRLLDWAFGNATISQADPDVVFYSPRCDEKLEDVDLQLYDPGMSDVRSEAQIELCHRTSDLALSKDGRVKSVRSAGSNIVWGQSLLLTSEGLCRHHIGTMASLGVSVIMEEGEELEIGSASRDFRYFEKTVCDNVPKLVAAEAVDKTALFLGGRPIKSGFYDVMLSNEVSACLLEAMSGFFLASNVYKGFSIFKDKIGETVGSSVLTVVDDGRLVGGFGSSLYDGEGVPTGRTEVVKNGVLQGYLSNLQYGKKLGIPSTGNCVRGFSSLPDVDVSNMYFEAGERSPEDMAREFDLLFFVTELMGLHTIDTTSGDFSMGARGLLMKKGCPVQSVSGVTVAGNLLDLFQRITLVGSDLRFFGNFGAASLVVNDVAISGE